ncbi:MAG: hypothetical protein ACP5G1_04415 [Nanopusillaceae archaeon]
MPVSIWLNENEKKLNIDEWVSLISKVNNTFYETFDFKCETIQLWNKSFFRESDGILIKSILNENIQKENPFENILKEAIENKYILKFSGIMKKPIKAEAFIVYFLKSEDRWGMPHIFFDTEIFEMDLVDALWEQKDKKNYVYQILDELRYIKIKLFNIEHKIIYKITIAKDFSDEESIKDKKVLLFYLTGPEYKFIKDIIKYYSKKNKKLSKKISPLNINKFSDTLYNDDFVKKIWYNNPEKVSVIPIGSLALISETEDGISNIFKSIENDIVIPFIEAVPENLVNEIINKIKEKNKIKYVKKIDEEDK